MIIRFGKDNETFVADLALPADISIPMQSGLHNPNAFHLPPPRFEPVRVGDFVGSVAHGSSANCENLTLNAHGNGTHTECIGHITRRRITIHESLKQFHFLARLITVTPRTIQGGDHVVFAPEHFESIVQGEEALIIRTLPNTTDKLEQMYSGQNPVYLDAGFAASIAACGINHLLIDLPSVDREEDGGAMAAHKAFWHYPERPRYEATITEMVFVPNHIQDGRYLLNLQIASLETDASPSKPVLYRLVHA